METVGTVHTREETVIEWSIPHFPSLSEERGVFYFSPLFFFHKASWCIELFPNGVKEDDSDRDICLCLHRRTSGPPIEIELRYGIKNAVSRSCLLPYTRYAFNGIEHNRSLFWASRSYLLENKSEWLPSDTLTLLCCIQHSRSTEFSDNLQEANSESVPFISKSNLASSNLETIGKINEREEFVVEWSIEDFLSFPVGERVSHFSPLFSFENIAWCIEVSRKEERRGESDEYIPIYLHKKSSGPLIRLECTFEYTNGFFIYFTDYVTCVFNATETDDGTQELLTRTPFLFKKYKDVTFDPLTLICRIKRPLYTEYPSGAETSKCSHCKETVDAKNLSTHEKKCMEKPIKCPECSSVVPLKNWYEHECKTSKGEGASNASTSSVIPPKNKILQDFKELFLTKENCDVFFKVKDQEIPAHKAILSVRSPVLASTFRHDMKEKTTGVVDIEDFDPSTFSDFLCYLYCEDTENISEKNVFSLFSAADKYDVSDLREKCMEFMKANLSVDTFCDTITLALEHTETDLISLSTDFFIQNADKIIETVQWQTFLVEYPTHSNELFIKLLAHQKNFKK